VNYTNTRTLHGAKCPSLHLCLYPMLLKVFAECIYMSTCKCALRFSAFYRLHDLLALLSSTCQSGSQQVSYISYTFYNKCGIAGNH